ncbi:MAG TPA: phasin family protein [Burkholderiales bacterium]|nr:phasin family protein [Burkholderiales bacterium]
MQQNLVAQHKANPINRFASSKEKVMYNVPEQLLATNKENLETFVEFAGIAAAGAEKLLDVQVKIAKAVFADTVKHAKTVVAAKDVQELTEIQTSVVQPSAEKAATYGRSIYSVIAETQTELGKFFEVRFADANKNLTTALDKAMKSAPAGSDVAVAAVKSAMAAANQAYDAFSKATKQVTEATEASITAASGVTAKKKAA